MQVPQSSIDHAFEGYKLFSSKYSIHESSVHQDIPVLEHRTPSKPLFKKGFHERVHANDIFQDPYRPLTAYYINQQGQIIGYNCNTQHTSVMCILPPVTALDTLQENISIVTGSHYIAISSGNDQFHLYKREEANQEWSFISSQTLIQNCGIEVLSIFENPVEGGLHLLVSVLTAKDQTYECYGLWISTFDHQSRRTHLVSSQRKVQFLSIERPLQHPSEELVLLLQIQGKHQFPAINATEGSGTESNSHIQEQHTDRDEEMYLRPGIGFDEGAHRSLGRRNTPGLYERFVPSTTPYSSLQDNPMSSSNMGNSSKLDQETHAQLFGEEERPTIDSLIGGFEDCDDVDPNAIAAVYAINENGVIQAKDEINCRSYQYLTHTPGTGRIIYQNDINGVLYHITCQDNQIVWDHCHTLQAMGFVQASKQQKKLLLVHPSGSIAAIAEFDRRAFIYRCQSKAEGLNEHERLQHIVEFGPTNIFGMQMLNADTMVFLTEGSIFTVRFE